MIYSFETNDTDIDGFVAALREHKLDFEIIRRDRVVVRVFGQIEQPLRKKLDDVAGKPGKLILMHASENRSPVAWPGDGGKLLIAGPCAVESEEQLDRIASFLSGLGITYLRGGAFKPRTSSESFQGLGTPALHILATTAARYGMKVVTELMDRSQLDDVMACADVIQVGSRNMFNYPLLTALGAVNKPILFKRGMAATIDEWVAAVDYIRRGGNEQIVLCERGIRTFETRTRFTLDILAIPLARRLSGLPVIADVSHAAGERSLVPPLMRAALAAGADGIMVEVHPDPDRALSDSSQSMAFDDFETVVQELRKSGLL